MSQRIPNADRNLASPETARVLDRVQRAVGRVPNLHLVLAHAPAALKSYVDFAGTLAGGGLDAKLRESLALAVAGANGCAYCAAAHTALGQGAGLDAGELRCNLDGKSPDGRTAAALGFARRLIDSRGDVTDEELAAVRRAGFGDAEILEIVAHVALNTFSNLVNNLARSAIDFPPVELRRAG